MISVSPQRILLLGATGLLGQALVHEAQVRGVAVIGIARRGCEHSLDLADGRQILELMELTAPDIVINAAGLTNLDTCEQAPAQAYAVNARAVSLVAESCRRLGCRLIQVSTDHYYTGDCDGVHDEEAQINLVNEYARTKFAGEAFALTVPDALVIRTNITGRRDWAEPTFFEWAVNSLHSRAPLSLFDDYFTSTIDVASLGRAIFDLADARASGVINVASRQVASKREFVEAIARALCIDLDWATTTSVAKLAVPRAESAGLAVSRAEAILGYALPDLSAVVAALTAEEVAA